MEKLRYLFENFNLAEMMVKNWRYDPESLAHFKRFRISSNAIYPFEINGVKHFLRLSPEASKLRKYIEDEINFTDYLRKEGYHAVKFVESLNTQHVETHDTPWGTYHASVMEAVPGVDLETLEMTEEMAKAFGAELGKLHRLSSTFRAEDSSRVHCEDVLLKCKGFLEAAGDESDLLRVIDSLINELKTIPKESKTYGLIHYDFDLDNVFYDERKRSMSTIDFDDCIFSWYGMDVVLSMDKIGKPDLIPFFLAGYETHFDVNLKHEDAFRKFTLIYSYTRIAQSMQEEWNNEPDWMLNLREKFKGYLTMTKKSILSF